MQLENSSNKTRQEPTCASTKMVEHAEMWSQTEERSRAKRLLWFNLRKKNSKK
jgi:DNA polymerase III psi subunit